jgi:hypothetical protein
LVNSYIKVTDLNTNEEVVVYGINEASKFIGTTYEMVRVAINNKNGIMKKRNLKIEIIKNNISLTQTNNSPI